MIRPSHAILCWLLAIGMNAVADAATPAVLTAGEGFVAVPGGPVWYRVFGSGRETPLLIVHGGPGSRSCTYDPLATLISRHRPVVVYDQLGSGRSGRPMDPGLWTLDRSVRELAAVRKALGLRKVHLMGHSWGGSLVADYLLTMKPSGIESLVLAGPLLSTRDWIADADILRSQLPADVQETLRRNEEAGTLHSKEYQDATQAFYRRFLVHSPDLKPPASCAEAPMNTEIYKRMWGPTEFKATGTLVTFDLTPELHRLDMPVLFVVGRYDEARLETIQRYQAMIPRSRVSVMENSGHLAPLEESAAYAAVLEEFLAAAERRANR